MGKFLRLFMIFVVRKILNPLYEMAEFLGAIERVEIPDDKTVHEQAAMLTKDAIEEIERLLNHDAIPIDKQQECYVVLEEMRVKLRQIERQNLWDTDPREWYK